LFGSNLRSLLSFGAPEASVTVRTIDSPGSSWTICGSLGEVDVTATPCGSHSLSGGLSTHPLPPRRPSPSGGLGVWHPVSPPARFRAEMMLPWSYP